MSRPRKLEDKPKDSGSLQISVEDFVRTRNSVVTGLATLQSAVSDLSRAYIAHTDTVIGRGGGTSFEQLNISNPLTGENVLFGQRGPTPAPTIEQAPENKKRKRAPHDKNAPKRALTPFFLYLQTARSTIADELGSGKTAKEVQDEGGRRWREMTDDDKKEWQEKYAINFMRYKEQMKSYKAGNGIPEISDAEAVKLYEDSKRAGKIPSPPDLDAAHVDEEAAADNDNDDEDEEDDDEEEKEEEKSDDTSSSDEESPEPVKAPPPKRSKTAKAGAKQVLNKEAEPVVTERSTQSPEKKKKKSSKKKDTKGATEAAEPQIDVAEVSTSPLKASSPETKKKNKGKKRKSEAT